MKTRFSIGANVVNNNRINEFLFRFIFWLFFFASILLLPIKISAAILPDEDENHLVRTSLNPVELDTNLWIISEQTVFTSAGEPANPFVVQLIDRLQTLDAPGTPLSLMELRHIINNISDRKVYCKQLIKYATPISKEIQDDSHANYLKRLLTEERQQAGICFLIEQEYHLRQAELIYGILPKDILGILMWESALGKYTGCFRIFNVFMGQILFLEQAEKLVIELMRLQDDSSVERTSHQERRLQRLRGNAVKNLAILLRMTKEKGVDPLLFLGSWGGAIGYVQFMPASLKFAVDGDEDGEINLMNWPDAIHSVANYLSQAGYRKTRRSRWRAIFAYNHLDSYVTGVMTYADTVWERFQGLGGYDETTNLKASDCQSLKAAR